MWTQTQALSYQRWAGQCGTAPDAGKETEIPSYRADLQELKGTGH